MTTKHLKYLLGIVIAGIGFLPALKGQTCGESVYLISQSGTFAPVSGTGTPVFLDDDDISGALPIGFTFNFFGNDYTHFYISSNGFITFSDTVDNGCCSGQFLPDSSSPNNLIAFAWEDLNPGAGGTIEYFTVGTAPSRKLIVNFINVPHYYNNNPVTSQVILYESTNVIEIHTTNMPSDGGDHTMGIENIDGTKAYVVSGRNATDWSVTNDYVKFSQVPCGANDAGIESIDSPYIFCSGVHNIVVTVQNYGTNPIDSLTVNWSINGSIQAPVQLTTILDTPGGILPISTQVVLGSWNFMAGNKDTITVWTSNPNGVADTVNFNDTLTAVLQPSIQGTFTIGGTNPDYNTFTEAVNDLKLYGVCGPVVFNVRAGTYYEQVELTDISGASDSNTITFQSESGDSTQVILTYSANSSANYTLRLNNAHHFIIKNITIQATNPTYGRVIEIMNQSHNNQFLNNQINGVYINSTSSNIAVVYSSSTNNNYNVFKRNKIRNGSYGIYFYGSGYSNPEEGTEILYNSFENQYFKSVYLYYQEAPIVSSNFFTTTSSHGYYNGINGNYCFNKFEFIGNKFIISNGGGYGIYCSNCDGGVSDKGLIANNVISVNGTSSGYGIYLYYSYDVNVYYNNVNVNSPSSAHTAFGAYYGDSITLLNNIFVNAGLGYSLYTNSTSNISNSDYNNLLTNGSVFAYRNGAINTFNEWKSTTGFDANSYNIDPQFTSFTDLHTSEPLLDGRAFPVPEVTYDYDGEPRDAMHPDIGADEFTPPPVDAGIAAVISPSVPFAKGLQPIILAVKNFGSDTLTSVILRFRINGIDYTPFQRFLQF